MPWPFHEGRFGAQAHELRGHRALPAHEARIATHERRLHAGSAGEARSQEPRSQQRHARRPHLASPTSVGEEHARHTRASIHRRHQARVAYRQALKQYHVELRAWRHALVERERLLRKLIALEKRLAKPSPRPSPRASGGITFEIEGQWFHQAAHHRATLLKKAPV